MNWLVYFAGLALGFGGLAVSHPGLVFLGLFCLMAAAINWYVAD